MPVGHFEPIATLAVSVVDEQDPEIQPVAKIIAATPDGQLLVLTDSAQGRVGFVDITDPATPQEIGSVFVDGEPTAVDITPEGKYALVTVKGDNEAQPLIPSYLAVLDLSNPFNAPVWELPLGGEPDAADISPDGRYAAIAVENERPEDEEPALPGGFLTIVDIVGSPGQWQLRNVHLGRLADRFPDDPETEFVSINENNIVAVTLQENNWIVTVDLATGNVLTSFSAGVTTHPADLTDDDVISFTENLTNVRREPDAIAWTPQGNLVTANEGDYDLDAEFVGGRNFTIFTPVGQVVFDSGAELEMLVAAAGLYNDGRSDNSGVEPEGIAVARYLNHTFLFVGMERANSVAVYCLTGNERSPKFVQILETGDRPEGLLPIPGRALFVTANEDDGTISIFAGRP